MYDFPNTNTHHCPSSSEGPDEMQRARYTRIERPLQDVLYDQHVEPIPVVLFSKKDAVCAFAVAFAVAAEFLFNDYDHDGDDNRSL